MYALQSILAEYCSAYLSTLRGTQIDVDVDNQSVIHAFNRGRALDSATHRFLVYSSDLQVRENFWLRLRRVPHHYLNVEAVAAS